MIYRLEKFPASAGRAHNLLKFDTLIIVNPKTRPSPMCSGKKNYWPPVPKNETPLQEYPAKYAAEG